MKRVVLKTVLLCVFGLMGNLLVEAKSQVEVFPIPDGVDQNHDFKVEVSVNEKKWETAGTYLVKVDQVKNAAHHEENSSMCMFDFEGKVTVRITYNGGTINTARIRPLSYHIQPKIEGNSILFTLDKPSNLSVEVNGDIFHNLQLFANPMDDFKPNQKDTNLIYFAPGVHHFDEGKFYVPSGKTVYLAGGAVLMGQVLFENVHDAKLMGRGVIDYSVKMGVHIANCKNIYVEGIVCTQCATGGSDSVTIRNVKSISYYGWGDGVNVFASNNVLFDGVFCRNSDDCTTVYATRKGFTGGCKNIRMQNSTLWADVAHPIQIGTHGNSQYPDTIENITYSNIDILDHSEMQIDYQGCMSINVGDNNFARNITFENIRVEDFRRGQLLNLRVFYNQKYCTAPGRGIENVLFKDITYNGTHSELSIIDAYNPERTIKNITFENLKINGQLISDDMPEKPVWYKTADMARIYVGDYVEGVVFK